MAYTYPYDEEKRAEAPQKLPTNRKMWKLILLSTLTLGIYSIFFFLPLSFELDKIAPKADRSKTLNYVVAFVVSIFTFSLVLIFWHHEIACRIEQALAERGISYSFGTSSFWGWYFFGSFIFVGPFVYFHKLCTAMNLLCEDYNRKAAAK